MSGRCEECGACTIWDQEVGSAICPECGTLADPTQSVLTSHLEFADTSGREFARWTNVPGGSTLRGRNGWALAGQGKEARDRKNAIAMHEFIRTAASTLASPGVTARAQGVFDQAMRAGAFRWGRKAKLTAGAALAIALRESHKSDSIRDIAYLLDEPPVAVTRAFGKVVQLLKLSLSTADPAVHLPTLQAHLASLVNGTQEGASGGPSERLPAPLMKILSPLVTLLPSIARTASALAWLVARTQAFAHLPTPPTACALLMLAVEGELASSLPNSGILAQALGARFSVGKGVVMQRYKQIYDIVEEWIRDIPWLDAHERKTTKSGRGEGRSKVAKRVVVARGLKDVVQFQEEIWRKRMETAGRPLLELDTDGKDDVGSGDEWDSSQQASSSRSSASTTSLYGDGAPPRKKQKTRRAKPVVAASHFLLNPLHPTPTHSAPSSTAGASRASPAPGAPDLLTHLLTADAAMLPQAFVHPPTRLQLLATARGGADEAHIADEELFAADELDGLFRSPEEVEVVRIAMGWDAGSDEGNREPSGEHAQKAGKKRKRAVPHADEGGPEANMTARGSKRINMDALARLLDPEADLALDVDATPDPGDVFAGQTVGDDTFGGHFEADEDEDSDDDGGVEDAEEASAREDPLAPPSARHSAGDEEIIEEWRPLSPGGGDGTCAEDWYDF